MDKKEEELSIYDSLQLIALQDFLQPTEEAFYRKLCRWLSSTFHTSIFDVEKQSLEYLLMHYFEYRLENFSKEDLDKHKRFLLHKEEVINDEDDDEAFAEELELEYLKKQQSKLDEIKNKKNVPKIPLPPDIKMIF